MSTKSTLTFANVLFGQVRGKVLALLYGRTDKAFYVRQIARHVSASVGAVQRELEKLAAVGLLVRTSVGNQVFYQINRQSAVFDEMRALVNKTVGVFSMLGSALEPMAGRIRMAFVYGSVARHEEKIDSDIDLMLIGDVELDDVLDCLSGVETALGRAVNPTLYSAPEFRKKLADGNHFLSAVLNGSKVFLLGDEDELRKMAGIRMGEARGQQRKGNQGSAGDRAAQSG